MNWTWASWMSLPLLPLNRVCSKLQLLNLSFLDESATVTTEPCLFQAAAAELELPGWVCHCYHWTVSVPSCSCWTGASWMSLPLLPLNHVCSKQQLLKDCTCCDVNLNHKSTWTTRSDFFDLTCPVTLACLHRALSLLSSISSSNCA